MMFRLLEGDDIESPLSKILGWSYFLCWSFSFYPQTILNCRRRKTDGLSIDFQWLNFVGFSCYAFYNCMMYWNGRVREDDAIRNGGESPDLVKLNDVGFALHALLLTGVTLSQVYVFGPVPVMALPWKMLLWIVSLVLLLTGVEVMARNIRWDSEASFFSHNVWTWLGFCLVTSFVKLGITLVKYVPQATLNYKRKSTQGWSICNILLDFSGGMLSLAQLVVDASGKGDLGLVVDNPVKLALSFISIGFDILFMVQHYYLYAPAGSPSSAYARVGIDDDHVAAPDV